MRFRLRWKILLLVVAAPLVLAAGSFQLVNQRISRNVRANIHEALHRSSLVCENVIEGRGRTLESSASVIVRDPRFFAALSIPATSRDTQFRATVRGVAQDFNKIAEADIFDVLDASGRPVASVGKTATTPESRSGLVSAVLEEAPAPRYLVLNGTLYLVSLTPVHAGNRRVGMLLLGTKIANALASDLRTMTRSEVTFLTPSGPSGTTLTSPGEIHALQRAIVESFASSKKGLPTKAFAVDHEGTTYVTLARPFPGATEGSREIFVLQRSLKTETAFLRDIQRGLTELGLITLVATLLLGHFVSRTITRPILALVRGAEEIERGNYEYRLAEGTQDEIGYLTRRFEDMREHERAHVHNLQEVAQIKSKFIDVASHELRTPTTVMKGYIEFLVEGSLGSVTDRQREALEAIQQNLQAIMRISENATWMAQIEGERPTLDRETFGVRSVLEEAVEVARGDAAGRKVDLVIEVADQGMRAIGDATRLVQAVAHLVRNGIRFTPDDGRVTVGAHEDGPALVIEVRDTGVGISAENCERLLERSLLVRDVMHHHSSSGLEFNSAGLGLGLPITRGIVEAHGGSITVASREGEGSVFTIRLPDALPPEIAQAA